METKGMDEDSFASWLTALVEELDYPQLFVDISSKVVGYTFNSRKKAVYFLTQKEADKLTKKGRAWKPIGAMWK